MRLKLCVLLGELRILLCLLRELLLLLGLGAGSGFAILQRLLLSGYAFLLTPAERADASRRMSRVSSKRAIMARRRVTRVRSSSAHALVAKREIDASGLTGG